MEKVLEILEKNVQWIVLGLAGVFLLWVAYAFVVTPPASVKMEGRTVLPGEVAVRTRNGPAAELEKQMKENNADFPTPDLVSTWRSRMTQPYEEQVASSAWDAQSGGKVVISTPGSTAVRVAALPVLPKAVPVAPLTGLSLVENPANAANAAQPAQPAPAQPVAATAPKDLTWVSVGATISGAALSQAMIAPLKGQPIDPALYNTALLQVELQRQKATLDGNGQPVFPDPNDSKSIEIVPPLVLDPAGIQPLPAETDPLDPKYKYIDWATANTALIATPIFYTVTAGTPWVSPFGSSTAPGGPANPAPGVPPAPAPQTAPAPAPAAGAMRIPPAIGRANASYAPADPRSPLGDGVGGSGLRPRSFPAPGINPGGLNNPGFQPDAGGAAGAGGQVNPFSIQGDIQIIAHDETVKPGQTYRYRFVYRMKNPIFNVMNMADKKLVDTFAIASPPSDWTAPVTVPDMTKFWVQAVPAKMDQAKLDVFQWLNGQWTKKNMQVGPGDAVPGTDLTVVDVRAADSHGKEKYVLLTTDSGRLIPHYLATDTANPEYQDLQNAVNPNPAGTGTGAAPPAPPPPTPNGRRPVPPARTGRPGNSGGVE